jgi:hypothetical protein
MPSKSRSSKYFDPAGRQKYATFNHAFALKACRNNELGGRPGLAASSSGSTARLARKGQTCGDFTSALVPSAMNVGLCPLGQFGQRETCPKLGLNWSLAEAQTGAFDYSDPSRFDRFKQA